MTPDDDVRDFKSAEDMVDETFVRKTRSVPMITFGHEFKERSDADKIDYLWKLASSLNDAAQQIQRERDELNEIAFKQHAQIKELERSRAADRQMIHRQLESANGKYQDLLKENQGLNREITKLEQEIEGLKAN